MPWPWRCKWSGERKLNIGGVNLCAVAVPCSKREARIEVRQCQGRQLQSTMSQKVAPVPIESLARQLEAGRGASCPAVMTVLLQGFPIRSQARHVKILGTSQDVKPLQRSTE